MSSITRRSASLDERTFWTYWRCSWSSSVISSSSFIPTTPFSGVRISWLMLARNSALAREADSARSRAVMSSSSPRCRASTSPRTRASTPTQPTDSASRPNRAIVRARARSERARLRAASTEAWIAVRVRFMPCA